MANRAKVKPAKTRRAKTTKRDFSQIAVPVVERATGGKTLKQK